MITLLISELRAHVDNRFEVVLLHKLHFWKDSILSLCGSQFVFNLSIELLSQSVRIFAALYSNLSMLNSKYDPKNTFWNPLSIEPFHPDKDLEKEECINERSCR